MIPQGSRPDFSLASLEGYFFPSVSKDTGVVT